MLYLFALVALVAITALCWRAFGPERASQIPRSRRSGRRVLGPDDDPEFLRRLDRGAPDGRQSGDDPGAGA